MGMHLAHPFYIATQLGFIVQATINSGCLVSQKDSYNNSLKTSSNEVCALPNSILVLGK